LQESAADVDPVAVAGKGPHVVGEQVVRPGAILFGHEPGRTSPPFFAAEQVVRGPRCGSGPGSSRESLGGECAKSGCLNPDCAVDTY
jgi:hypothetical protein